MHFGRILTLACSVGVAACGASTDPVGLPNHHDAGATTASGGAAGAAGPGSGGAAGAGGMVSGGAGSGGITDGGHEAPTGTVDAGRDAGRIDATSMGDNLAPAQGALLGLYYGAGTVAATEATLGRQIAIHLVYYAWNDDWAAGTTKSDLMAGRIPLVNWESAGIDFQNIVNGSLDATIKARAAGAKALGKNFFLDFAAEMNGDEAWSGNDAALYVAAYRHIHDLFVAAGATNVVWAWCPNVTDIQGGNATTMSYYPGDDYVDWTGVDGYNWGTTNGGWQSFKQVFQRIYPLLAAKGKPILIGEMASAEAGGDKAQWIADIIPTLKASYPLFKGLVWFDVNKETDWRIASSPATLAAFKAMANDPYFNP